MKLRFLVFLFVLIATGSCKKETPLFFSTESFTEDSFDICKNIGCPDITVNYLMANGNSPVSDKINTQLQAFVIGSLNIGEDSIPKAKTISEAASEFIKIYRLDAADFPDMSAEYFAEVTISESYRSDNLISLEMRQYLYTGGAHGYGSATFLNIDPETGAEIPSEELFKDFKSFTIFAETRFREVNKIELSDPINSTGFWFDDDLFYIPDALGFTENSMILIYNQYEIASYTAGPIELEISMEEVLPYLNLN